MLNRDKIMKLLKENNFNGIIDYFEDAYFELLKNYLINNNIEVVKDDKITDLMYKIELNFPRYSTLMLNLSIKLYDEELNSIDRINKMVDMYKVLKEKLT